MDIVHVVDGETLRGPVETLRTNESAQTITIITSWIARHNQVSMKWVHMTPNFNKRYEVTFKMNELALQDRDLEKGFMCFVDSRGRPVMFLVLHTHSWLKFEDLY